MLETLNSTVDPRLAYEIGCLLTDLQATIDFACNGAPAPTSTAPVYYTNTTEQAPTYDGDHVDANGPDNTWPPQPALNPPAYTEYTAPPVWAPTEQKQPVEVPAAGPVVDDDHPDAAFFRRIREEFNGEPVEPAKFDKSWTKRGKENPFDPNTIDWGAQR